jgi:hypothetical protein
MEHEEMLLAEPLEMTDVFFPDDMPLFKGAALKFAGPYLGDIMGKDRAYSLCYPNCFA